MSQNILRCHQLVIQDSTNQIKSQCATRNSRFDLSNQESQCEDESGVCKLSKFLAEEFDVKLPTV